MTESNEAVAPPVPPWWRHYLREHPALLLSVGYLFLTLVGAIYNWRLCSRFGVNILDLADGADFLMFAVRDLAVVLWALFAVLVYAGTYALMARLLSKPEKERTRLMRIVYRNNKGTDLRGVAVACTLWAVFFVYYFLNVYAGNVALGIKAGKGRACEYALSEEPKAALQSAQLVTTTSRFVVLYRPDEKTTQVIPLESVSRLVFVAPKRR